VRYALARPAPAAALATPTKARVLMGIVLHVLEYGSVDVGA